MVSCLQGSYEPQLGAWCCIDWVQGCAPLFELPVTYRCDWQVPSVCVSRALAHSAQVAISLLQVLMSAAEASSFPKHPFRQCRTNLRSLAAPPKHNALACLEVVDACFSKGLHMAELNPGLALPQPHTAPLSACSLWATASLMRRCMRQLGSSLPTSPTTGAWPAPWCGCTSSSRPWRRRARPTVPGPGRR